MYLVRLASDCKVGFARRIGTPPPPFLPLFSFCCSYATSAAFTRCTRARCAYTRYTAAANHAASALLPAERGAKQKIRPRGPLHVVTYTRAYAPRCGRASNLHPPQPRPENPATRWRGARRAGRFSCLPWTGRTVDLLLVDTLHSAALQIRPCLRRLSPSLRCLAHAWPFLSLTHWPLQDSGPTGTSKRPHSGEPATHCAQPHIQATRAPCSLCHGPTLQHYSTYPSYLTTKHGCTQAAAHPSPSQGMVSAYFLT